MKNPPADLCISPIRLSLSGALRFGLALSACVIIVVLLSGVYKPPFPIPPGQNSQLLPEERLSNSGTGREDPTEDEIFKRSAVNVSIRTPDHQNYPPPKKIKKVLPLSPPSIKESCLSRNQTRTFLRDSPHLPSPHLLQTLKNYEELHKSCGPRTQSFKKAFLSLRSSSSHGPHKCKYLIWRPENGLGNQMISLASTFLYSILSHRVLLIDRGKDLHSLFCEPFPESTWFLSQNFSTKFRLILNKTNPSPDIFYARLSHDYGDHDKRFYCQKDQNRIRSIPWMVLKSDQYFLPALFLIPEFGQRIDQLFPERETIFHHLSRYLFLPGDSVYNLIKTHRELNFPDSRERIGIQLRIHGSESQTIDLVTRQIVNCTADKSLLPNPNSSSNYNKTVLITSLRPEFLGKLGRTYKNSGLRFYQPSQEGKQKTGKEEHDVKALSEIFLLGLVDELLTSSWSTFGYVAQGIGGITPWILRGPVHSIVPSPTCVRDMSMEPCFHFPPNYDCETGGFMLTKKMLPFVKQCRDRSPGVKLVDPKRKKPRH